MKNGVLAIIPARSGSKGLRDKNIKLLNGKPLINYTIEAAKKSKIFDDIIVSTDNLEYKIIAEKAGATVPFLRGEMLSSDTATSNRVIADVLDRLKQQGKKYKTFVLLQPTSPLRNETYIKKAYDLFVNKNANAVISVTEAEHSPLWFNKIEQDLCIDNFLKNVETTRQELEKYYRINGAIYISDIEYFYKYKNYYHRFSFAYIMEKWCSVDIDDEFDFEFAEFLIRSSLLTEKR